jgi:hypothetical protein
MSSLAWRQCFSALGHWGRTMVKLSAWLSIAAGITLGAAQLLRNWENWQNWPSWMVDEFAALVMIAAGLLALRKRTTRLLPVGWSFACGLYVSALIGHLNTLAASDGELHVATQRLVVIVAGLLGVSVLGLVLVIFDRRPA